MGYTCEILFRLGLLASRIDKSLYEEAIDLTNVFTAGGIPPQVGE